MLQDSKNFNYIIIGGGIVGLSVAYELSKNDGNTRIAILDKELELGLHASGRNSGVLHCGIYYRDDSLKAKVCATGAQKMKLFAKEHGIPIFNGGKVILPADEKHAITMQSLMNNAKKNGVEAHWIDEKQLLAIEPFAKPVQQAIYCPTTSVIDIKAVLESLKKILIQRGIQFFYGCKVLNIQSRCQQIVTNQGNFYYQYFFNCAGAYADSLAKMEGLGHQYTLLPFKGIYYKMTPESSQKVRSNIYPVPDTSTPFLGVHFTRSVEGTVYVGPTAIPVLGRENYYRFQGMNYHESRDLFFQLTKLMWSNKNHFRRLARTEIIKYSKIVFFKNAKKLLPSLNINDLQISSKAGIRPQLMNKQTKSLEMDYIFEKTENSIHVLNAISPAFTSSFAFAQMIIRESGVSI